MKALLRKLHIDVDFYALMFVCPGCKEFGGSGIHMLPVNTTATKPAWTWDGNLEKPTLSPSILSAKGTDQQCHSYLKNGMFKFLGDCKHSLAGQEVEMPDLPDWLVKEGEDDDTARSD